ncbi:hypothetical protein BDZ45DRAFT_213838 [Acephala macrosclerotiorum]|nr:hypothetical protein BDZ45DRAFT_213838 [Acephala macrosclerotiorum]
MNEDCLEASWNMYEHPKSGKHPVKAFQNPDRSSCPPATPPSQPQSKHLTQPRPTQYSKKHLPPLLVGKLLTSYTLPSFSALSLSFATQSFIHWI